MDENPYKSPEMKRSVTKSRALVQAWQFLAKLVFGLLITVMVVGVLLLLALVVIQAIRRN